MPSTAFTPYSTVKPFLGAELPTWYPQEDRDRVGGYVKYDEMYWNDDSQFALRVLEGEQPIYIPNARTVVDTTSYYLLKGLQITVDDPEKNSDLNTALGDFLDRELFYNRFHVAKHAGVARGDFVMHMTANPKKPAGSRISLNAVDPCNVIPVYDDDDINKLLKVHMIDIWIDPLNPNDPPRIKKLTYEYDFSGNTRRVMRSEAIYSLETEWWGQKPKMIKQLIAPGYLPDSITTIPIYWFKNMDWQGQEYGSSELRGFERLLQGISQAGTDQSAALSLEGLGVYATDGGRPVNERGEEVDWEVSPGKVMEVPTGSYFRRVEGLSSMKPSMDHINYIESKLREAGGLSDVALGRVDVQTASSGIALAIKFMPTLAKLDERDTAGLGKLKQLFYDWKNWHALFENQQLEGEIIPVIGQKLPQDRTATINELNNMLDRKVISIKYYRAKMQELGYEFPDDIQNQIDEEADAAIERQRKVALISANAGNPNSGGDQQDSNPPPQGSNGKPSRQINRSNNSSRPNESAGTESGQTLQRQARGGKPQ